MMLEIEVDHPRTADWLIDSGWLDPAEAEDLDAISQALSAALAAWVADPARSPKGPAARTRCV
jgi:hypothetical protein